MQLVERAQDWSSICGALYQQRVRPLLISTAQQLRRQRGRTATGIFTAAFPVSSPVRCYQTWPHVLSLTRSAVTRV